MNMADTHISSLRPTVVCKCGKLKTADQVPTTMKLKSESLARGLTLDLQIGHKMAQHMSMYIACRF